MASTRTILGQDISSADLDLAGPFNKWKVDFKTGQYYCSTDDKSSKARQYPCSNIQRKYKQIFLQIKNTMRQYHQSSKK